MTAIPVEHDMLSRLQGHNKVIVVTPQPVRPLRTTICIKSSNIVVAGLESPPSKKTTKEVEAEVEKDPSPAVVSGVQGHLFLVNEGYKEMVGQPVCPWLDSLPGTGPSRRISGEVVLKVQAFNASSSSSSLPSGCATAFPCTVRISWELGGGTITSLTVPCAVERLTGNDWGNYRSIWRFDSTRASIIYCLA